MVPKADEFTVLRSGANYKGDVNAKRNPWVSFADRGRFLLRGRGNRVAACEQDADAKRPRNMRAKEGGGRDACAGDNGGVV
jgi:hypothetical protein